MVISVSTTNAAVAAPHYQVGGSLRRNSATYIQRTADETLYTALLSGEYCYLFNARQMGKSSLRVRMQERLTAAGKRCASVDMTSIGSEQVTPLQWYKGLMVDLLSKFELTEQIKFQQWWESKTELSMVQRLRLFIEEVLLRSRPDEEIYIFVDEIDSALALNFPIDDFFALVRYCYNQRSEDPAYQRLTWSLFGVVMPSELIQDSRRTPFNVGQAIELKGLVFEDAKGLAQGLAGYGYDSLTLLKEILGWTNGQPFLTQKLCQLTAETLRNLPSAKTEAKAKDTQDDSKNEPTIAVQNGADCTVIGAIADTVTAASAMFSDSEAAALIDSVVYTRIIDHWESQDDPEHLRTIRDRILRKELQAPRLLGIYQTILTSNLPTCEIAVAANSQAAIAQTEEERRLTYDDSPEHLELLLSGLIGLYQGRLAVKSRIYEVIFDMDWVTDQLTRLRPYAKPLSAWEASGQTDESRLLRGKALKDAQAWSQERSVGEIDHTFLMASERYDRRVVQQTMKSARLKEVEKRLLLERKVQQRQRGWIGSLSGALVFMVVLGGVAWIQSQRARHSQLEAMVTSAEALYSSDQRLDALLQAVKAKRVLDTTWHDNSSALHTQVMTALRTAAVGVVEQNRLVLEHSNFWDVDIDATGNYLASTSDDGKVRLWRSTGELLSVLSGHKARVRSVMFAPNGEWLVSGSDDHEIRIWSMEGPLMHTLRGHVDRVNDVAVSPDGELLASASRDLTVKLWKKDGTLLTTLEGHSRGVLAVTFSPDGKTLLSAGEDATIKAWDIPSKTLTRTFEGHSNAVSDISFAPSGQIFASSGYDRTIRLWNLASEQSYKTVTGHEADVLSVSFSPDGHQLASTSRDTTVRLWTLGGEPLATLAGHQGRVTAVKFNPDSASLISAGFDKTVRLWRLNNPLQTQFIGAIEGIMGVDMSPDGALIAAASDDRRLHIWQRRTGRQVGTFRHPSGVLSVRFSPDGQSIVTGGWDSVARLWDITGEQLAVLEGHQRPVWDTIFSPDGETIATSSADGKIHLWDRQGQLQLVLSGHLLEVGSVAFSSDGQYLLSASLDSTVKLWDLEGRLLQIFDSPSQTGFIDANISPDGQMIATAGFDNVGRLWDIDTGEIIAELEGHEAEIRSIRFSADGQQVVTAGGDGQVTVWKSDGEHLSTLIRDGSPVWEASFSEGDDTVVAAGEGRNVFLWDLTQVLDDQQLMDASCTWLSDYLQTSPDSSDSDRDVCS